MSQVTVISGTFDLSHLEQATTAAASIAEDLRSRFENFNRLETLKDDNGRFLWLAYFDGLKPLKLEECGELIESFGNQVSGASVSFNLEESRSYDLIYSGPPAPAD